MKYALLKHVVSFGTSGPGVEVNLEDTFKTFDRWMGGEETEDSIFTRKAVRDSYIKLRELQSKPWMSKNYPWGDQEKICLEEFLRITSAFILLCSNVDKEVLFDAVSGLFCLAAWLQDSRREYHHFNPKFCSHLNRTNLKVKNEILRASFQKQPAFFCETEPGVFEPQPDGCRARGFIATIRRHATIKKKDALTIFFHDYDENYNQLQSGSYASMDIESFDTIEESFNHMSNVQMAQQTGVSLRNVELAVKMILYATSGDPDLRHELPIPRPATSNEKKQRQFDRENPDNPPGPVLSVGYGFMKDRIQHLESTLVDGHWRWQRHGPGWQQVKLIWIDEFERKYKNAMDHSVSPIPSDSYAEHP